MGSKRSSKLIFASRVWYYSVYCRTTRKEKGGASSFRTGHRHRGSCAPHIYTKANGKRARLGNHPAYNSRTGQDLPKAKHTYNFDFSHRCYEMNYYVQTCRPKVCRPTTKLTGLGSGSSSQEKGSWLLDPTRIEGPAEAPCRRHVFTRLGFTTSILVELKNRLVLGHEAMFGSGVVE